MTVKKKIKSKKRNNSKNNSGLAKLATITTKSISGAFINFKKSQEQKKIKEIKLKKLQEHSEIIREKKDLRVLDENPELMPNIFFKMFKSSPKTVIKFLSNKSNFLEDLSIILKMPKWTFVKALFR